MRELARRRPLGPSPSQRDHPPLSPRSAHRYAAPFAFARTTIAPVGTVLPPACSSVTPTVEPGATASVRRTVLPAAPPWKRPAGVACFPSTTQASYVLPGRAGGRFAIRTACRVGATTSRPLPALV